MDLFIGITTWNSEKFIGHCLNSIFKTTDGINPRVVVLDNASTDQTVQISEKHGAEIITRKCSQKDALNYLLNLSSAKYTLLIHADVVFLSSRWFELCSRKIDEKIILVSPEDIGCGPYTRPYGINMPESSFMFFETQKIKSLRKLYWHRKFKRLLPVKGLDFYITHVTHNIPALLDKHGYKWFKMNVLVSDKLERPVYMPEYTPGEWSEELSYLRYGLGNFYSIDNEITHYHNWYDRISNKVRRDKISKTEFPVEFIDIYTDNFLKDLLSGSLILPSPIPPTRQPESLRKRTGSGSHI